MSDCEVGLRRLLMDRLWGVREGVEGNVRVSGLST